MKIKLRNLNLVLTEPSYLMPCNRAHQHFLLIHRWLKDNTFDKEAAFLNACIHEFHPKNAGLKQLHNGAVLAGMFISWEEGNLKPDKLSDFDYAVAAKKLGLNALIDWGDNDWQKFAITVVAALVAYEGGEIAKLLNQKIHDSVNIWQHLYWFERFYKCYFNLSVRKTPSAFKTAQIEAKKTLAWKREAWIYYLSLNNKLTDSAIALNFITKNPGRVSKKHLQDYFTERKKKRRKE